MNIQKLIDKSLEREERKYSGKIGASILGQCQRRQFFSIKREPQTNPPDDRTFRVFECGNLFHKFIQDVLVENGYEVEKKYEDDTISIRVDAVSDEELLEIKSQHSRAFWYMKKGLENKTIKELKPEVVLQATLGAWKLKKEYIRLVFVSKDDLCIQEFLIKVTDEMITNVKKEIKRIKTNLEKGLPRAKPRLYPDKKTGKPKECQYCNWKEKCMELDDNDFLDICDECGKEVNYDTICIDKGYTYVCKECLEKLNKK